MTKIISVSDEAYDRLKRMKGKRSFTKIILSLTEGKKQKLSDFAGIWEDNPEMDAIFKEVAKGRHKRSDREISSW